jgi:hypothetical protein
MGVTLDDHGVQLVDHKWEHIDYYDNSAVLTDYYPECCRLVQEMTGAAQVVAFDHNVRSNKPKVGSLTGGNKVQGPAGGVHADYSLTSAPKRVRDLSMPLGRNDTLRAVMDEPPIAAHEVDSLLEGRYAIINVWRNIATEPVQKWPLGVCLGTSVPTEDIVTFQVRYADRTGENYLSTHSDSHKWVYFDRMEKDEAMLLKCWDSFGRDFANKEVVSSGRAVPATFCFHSAFQYPTTPPNVPDRESIEVRTIAFFPVENKARL